MEITPINEKVLVFIQKLIMTRYCKLRYVAFKALDFKDLSDTAFTEFLNVFNLPGKKCFDMIKFQSCNFLNYSSIYSIYQSPVLTRTRNFREICSTVEDHELSLESGMNSNINSNILSLLVDSSNDLDGLDVCSIIYWPLSLLVVFIETWCQKKVPKLFKKFSFVKTEGFDHVVDGLKTHPWIQSRKNEACDPLVFKNKNNDNLELIICWDSVSFYFDIIPNKSINLFFSPCISL